MIDQSAYGYELDIFLIEMSFGSVGAPAPAIDSGVYRDFKSYHRGRGCHSSQLLLVLEGDPRAFLRFTLTGQ